MNLVNRISDGWLRLLITICYGSVSLLFLYAGVDLIKTGAKGKWEIVADFKEMPLYITSISPGVFVILASILIMCWGLPTTIKNLK